MAFVNKGDDQQRSERADSGEPFDFDPNDPTVVKVHYDLAAWNFDQRAELSEALAAAELPHAWDGDEIVIPEQFETEIDALFEYFDEELGPFPVVLADDEPSTDFVLDEWSLADRTTLSDALIESEIPHRWKGTTVDRRRRRRTRRRRPARCDRGRRAAGHRRRHRAPDGALGTMFVAADKLAKDPLDADARTTLLELGQQIDAKHPPYGLAPRAWSGAVRGVTAINDKIVADSATPVRGRRVGDDRSGPGAPLVGPTVRLTSAVPPHAPYRPMLLAELEVWHTRPAVPTRRIALGHMVLPVDPAPGFGGLLLGSIVAAHLAGVDDDFIPDIHRSDR